MTEDILVYGIGIIAYLVVFGIPLTALIWIFGVKVGLGFFVILLLLWAVAD